jgi:hypothetical protein
MGLLERLGFRYEDGAKTPDERTHPTRAFRSVSRRTVVGRPFERRRQPGGVVEVSAVRGDRGWLREHDYSVVAAP